MKKGIDYMKKHPVYHATIHAIGGIALGILVMYVFNLKNPLIWVIVLGSISIGGHLYAFLTKKK